MYMNITLIGMSGVGKTTIGKELAMELNYAFLDTDRIIEKQENKPIIDVLKACETDKEFLDKEEKVILSLNLNKNSVISPGGSVIYEDKAMKFLKANSKIVFLYLPLKKLKQIIGDAEKRAIIGIMEKGLEGIYKERYPLYEKCADIKIDLSNIDINASKEKNRKIILTRIKEKLGLE